MLDSFSKSYWMKIGRNVKEASGNDWSPTVSSKLHSYLRYIQLVIQLKFPSQFHFSRYRIRQVKPDSPCSMHDAPYKPKISKSDCKPRISCFEIGRFASKNRGGIEIKENLSFRATIYNWLLINCASRSSYFSWLMKSELLNEVSMSRSSAILNWYCMRAHSASENCIWQKLRLAYTIKGRFVYKIVVHDRLFQTLGHVCPIVCAVLSYTRKFVFVRWRKYRFVSIALFEIWTCH